MNARCLVCGSEARPRSVYCGQPCAVRAHRLRHAGLTFPLDPETVVAERIRREVTAGTLALCCAVCGTPFRRSVVRGRPDDLTCGTRCRARRARLIESGRWPLAPEDRDLAVQARVRALLADGLSPVRVAGIMQVSTAPPPRTAQRWTRYAVLALNRPALQDRPPAAPPTPRFVLTLDDLRNRIAAAQPTAGAQLPGPVDIVAVRTS
jgi:hypothetical protein